MTKLRHLLLAAITLFGLASTALAQPTLESLGKRGSYQVAYYSQFPPKDEYAAATLYFPANRGTDFGGVVISPGYTEVQENIAWWGQHLASWGYAVLILDTNTPQDNPQLRADALMAGIDTIRGEGVRRGSPIRGKILDDSMAVMGHSMGGGGALLAANDHSEQLKAAIPFTPWLPDGDFSAISVPTLVLAGETDQIATVAEHAWPHYQSLSDDLPRMYAEIAGGNHFIANSVTENEGFRPNIDVQDLVGALAVAWLKLYVDGDEDYRSLLYGEWPAEQMSRLSRFEGIE
jgi:dienelactone hydrolase